MGKPYGPSYPSEIITDSLYLGSAASAKSDVLSALDITHVVSVIDRAMPEKYHSSIQRLHCSIPDSTEVDLTPTMHAALPFIASAIEEGGRVLVHCERGASRSASVVTAYLMASQHGPSDLQSTLETIKAARPCVRPNEGFMSQLKRRRWAAEKRDGEEKEEGAGRKRRVAEARSANELSEWITAQCYHALDVNYEQEPVECATMAEWLEGECSYKSTNNPRRLTSTPVAHDLGHCLGGLLSRSECREIIGETERIGYGVTSYPKSYRGNRRLQLDDTSGVLSKVLWERMRDHVPTRLTVDWIEGDEVKCGIWEARGLNTRYRFSKYFPGERFMVHRDAQYYDDSGLTSFLTVNIYLNDLEASQAGRTRFFLDKAEAAVDATGGVAGSCVLFKQEAVLHDGEPLVHGLKYLMRTDVMFERVADLPRTAH